MMTQNETLAEEPQSDNDRLYAEMVIKDSIIQEYQQALATAQFRQASLNGQLKLGNNKIRELEQLLDQATEPTV